jgi:glycosyltransferase involved in cell wall biosynthesis
MRILIIEPHANGHHASYLRWLVLEAERRKWQVVIATTPAALRHPALSRLAAEFSNVQIHLMESSRGINLQSESMPRLLWREFLYWASFKSAVREISESTGIDLIVLPYMDYCFYALGLLGGPFRGMPWCAISMRLALSFSAGAAGGAVPLKWRIAGRILRDRNLKALFVINPSVQDLPLDWYSQKKRARLRYLADPAENSVSASREESRTALGITATTVAILVFGSIDERKGINFLIEQLVSHDDFKGYTVILAGKQSEEVRAQMRGSNCERLRSEGRLIVYDRFLDAEEQGDVFAAADVVWVGYRSHFYMSGVLVLAGRNGLPVIGTSDGEIGRMIAKHGLGIAARIHDPKSVAHALRAMLNESVRSEMGGKARVVFALHTVENFGASVLGEFDSTSA